MKAPENPCGRAAFYRLNAIARGRLHRAIVALPERMCSADHRVVERVVFFEAPISNEDPGRHLEQLLSVAWCAPDIDWENDGYIYNLHSAYDYLVGAESMAPDSDGMLKLFASGWGGEDGIGPECTHYSRAKHIDLFVSPRVAAVLRDCIAQIEALYAAKASEAAA